jgi:hypothetical protein
VFEGSDGEKKSTRRLGALTNHDCKQETARVTQQARHKPSYSRQYSLNAIFCLLCSILVVLGIYAEAIPLKYKCMLYTASTRPPHPQNIKRNKCIP